ncbi:PREDICTED: rootletin-like [Vollenhovia emeryi]|uniref:rootletin-like n=1 Tax=Vollenhovia emeryi TaxID=411798 RepID=UPI0005F48A0D|nr:PREDICTED: rootletin-like [Vollenhovia emeryi]
MHGDSSGDIILDVDPEAVRKGIRSLMQQVAQIERERDDHKTKLCSLKKQLKESKKKTKHHRCKSQQSFD